MEESSPKRVRHGTDLSTSTPSRFVEGRREESMSKQGREIQHLMRQELQKRMARKLGLTTDTPDADDSIEVESRHLHGKTGLASTTQLRPKSKFQLDGNVGNVIPVKTGKGTPGIGTGDSDDSLLWSSKEVITAPTLTMQGPTIVLVPGREMVLPKDKKIPVKHADVTQNESRALVIPAAKVSPVRHTRTATTARSIAPPVSPPKSQIPIQSPIKYANFTMGSIPTTSGPSRRKSLRTAAARGLIPRPSPVKQIRTTRSVSANTAKKGASTIRVVHSNHNNYYNKDIQVPVKFDDAKVGNGKRKLKGTAQESSPMKRVKLNQVLGFLHRN
jgi:hypothetical protein